MVFIRDLVPLQLAALNADSDDSAAGIAEKDLSAYIHVGHREMKAVATIIPTGTDTDETCDLVIQESSSTADGDFSEITGATFTQVTQAATPAVEQIHFNATKRYIRAVPTLAGTTPTFAIALNVMARVRSTTT